MDFTQGANRLLNQSSANPLAYKSNNFDSPDDHLAIGRTAGAVDDRKARSNLMSPINMGPGGEQLISRETPMSALNYLDDPN
jgi:hypothetical protein